MEERIVVADPVLDPQGYQRELLALLGTSDPLEVMGATPATFRKRTADLPAGAVERRPAPREWSVAELLGHLWDAEIAYAFRARAILAQDQPPLIGYDQDRWVQGLNHNDDDPSALLDQFEAMRLANVSMWRRASPNERSRVGIHEERGPESYDLTFRLIGGHDRIHLAQARESLQSSVTR